MLNRLLAVLQPLEGVNAMPILFPTLMLKWTLRVFPTQAPAILLHPIVILKNVAQINVVTRSIAIISRYVPFPAPTKNRKFLKHNKFLLCRKILVWRRPPVEQNFHLVPLVSSPLTIVSPM